jgi:hypothetical protein
MKIEILSVPECPNLAPVRVLLQTCLDHLGARAEVTERVGDFPSPTVLVNGIDVMGPPPHGGASCRLDAPTEDRVRAALRAADH